MRLVFVPRDRPVFEMFEMPSKAYPSIFFLEGLDLDYIPSFEDLTLESAPTVRHVEYHRVSEIRQPEWQGGQTIALIYCETVWRQNPAPLNPRRPPMVKCKFCRGTGSDCGWYPVRGCRECSGDGVVEEGTQDE